MITNWPLLLITCLTGYLLGSLPSGVLISKLAGIDDITSYGSGNTGTTNVLRVLGPKYAAVVLVLDMAKGALPVYFALKYMNIGLAGPFIVGACAIMGHNWSAFLNFKGGKGVATTAGVALIVFPKIIIMSFVVFVIVVGISKYVSLGSITAVWAGFAYSLLPDFTIIDKWTVLVLAVAVTYTHRSNIRRLLSGTELKLGQKGEKR